MSTTGWEPAQCEWPTDNGVCGAEFQRYRGGRRARYCRYHRAVRRAQWVDQWRAARQQSPAPRPRVHETAKCEWAVGDGTCGAEFTRVRASRPTVWCEAHRAERQAQRRRAWKQAHPDAVRQQHRDRLNRRKAGL